MVYLLFIIWFVFLVKWADLLVNWASSVAMKFKISPLVIWLTIVAFGTSAPELVVNIISGFNWKTDMAIWNILWSNIANISLILWICSIISPLNTKKSIAHREVPFALLWVITLGILANDVLISWSDVNIISKTDWLILLCFFVVFFMYTIWMAKKNKSSSSNKKAKQMSLWKSVFYIIVWLIWLALWWKWIVDWATQLALLFWLSETVIWLTVVAIGTSLPELATSVVAVLKKETDIAIWNIVWSNIFNIFLILGITGIISPIWINSWTNMDILMTLLATLLLLLSLFLWKKYVLEKKEWIIMLIMYIIYIMYLLCNS